MTPRRAAVLALGLLAAASLAAALAARLGPLPDGAAERRAARLRARAARALEGDAGRLAGAARSLAADPALAEILEGGSAGVRPGRLHELLGSALPEERGWGAVLLDRNGEAVAWAGEPGDLPAPGAARAGPFAATFRVTEFTLSHETGLGRSPETRGRLFVTRRFPTGVLRPDVLDTHPGLAGPSGRRLRIRAAAAPDRLLAVDLEPASPGAVEEDVRRAATLPRAVTGAVALVLLGLLVRRAGTGAVAARLLLLLAVPAAETGPFAPVLRDATGLVATPADLALTAVVALVLLREALASASAAPRRLASRLGAAGAAVLIPAGAVLLAFRAGRSAPSLLLGLGLFSGPPEAPIGSAGLAALSAAALGLAALLLSAVLRPGRASLPLAAAGIALTLASPFAAPSPAALALLVAGALLLVAGLADGVAAFRSGDLLSKAVVAALLVGAGALVAGSAASLGRLARADERLERAATRSTLERERLEEEGPAAFEERVADPTLEPWTPAGERTIVSDLARALWLRGRDAEFPEPGDLLTVRDDAGRVLSSFGTMRPGDDERGTAIGLLLPVPGTLGVLSRAPWPDPDDVDPLLVEALGEPVHGDAAVERTGFDGAGRPLGRGRSGGSDLPAAFLDETRRTGEAWGVETSRGRRVRTTVRRSGNGFVSWGVELPTTAYVLGSAAAAAETALPFALLVLLRGEFAALGRRLAERRGRRGGRLFGTFRGRLAVALLASGAVPLAAGAVMVRTTLDRSAARATESRALQLLGEGRRVLEGQVLGTPSPADLNRAASVVGVDLLLYRRGRLAAASRAVPVAAGLAPERLAAPVARALANGASAAASTRAPRRPGGRRLAEAGVTLSREEGTTLAVVLAEDPAGREAVDGLVLLAVAVALGALALGGRGALALSKPVESLVAAAERVGAGDAPGPIETPETADLARLVDAFRTMSERVRERTDLLEREREAAVSVLASLTPAALLFRDGEGRVLFANPAADALLPPGELLSERLPPTRFGPVLAALRSPRPFETRVTLRSGGSEAVLRVVVVDLSADATSGRTLLLLEDLTDFTRAERLEAWVEAARAVAHDIKNPLTPIRLTAERLLRGADRGVPPDAARIVEAAETILRQVALLSERTGRLSRFASPAAPERVVLTGGEIGALVREVAADYSAHPGVRVRCDAPDDLPDVLVDPALLRDAVSNFVLNAVEALEPDGGEVVVTARAPETASGRRELEVACEDDGPGVPETDLGRLFDPTFSTKSRGSGMGLAAARRAVEEHGGRLFAERSPAGGLRIGFVLPAARR